MASKKFEKGSTEFNFFGDFYRFAQKYYFPDDSDEYWDAVLKDASELNRRYPGNFCKHIVQGFLDYAEAENKERMGK